MLISAHLVIMDFREWCAKHITFQSNPFTKQLVYIQVQRSSKRGTVKLGHSSCAFSSAQREKHSSVIHMKIVYSQADYLSNSYFFPALTFQFLCTVYALSLKMSHAELGNGNEESFQPTDLMRGKITCV